MLIEANPPIEEIGELYEDLKLLFETPFDDKINEAMSRGNAYIETPSKLPQ